MATWKKLVVSSSAISQLNNDSGYLVASSTGVNLGGAFSGSFQGDGSNLTGVTAGTSNPLVDGAGIIDFSYNGSSAGVSVSVDSGSLAGNGITTSGGKFVVEAADSTISVGASGINVVEANFSGIPNTGLTNDGIMLGTTDISLGTTGSSVAGLTLTNATVSGSFSGSFEGTTDLPDLTDGNGIQDFTYDGSSTATIIVDTGSLAGNGLDATGNKLIVKADSTTGGNNKPVTVGANGVSFDISTIDGNGIGIASNELSVNVDDSSIEINSDSLRVKEGGVTNAMLANDGLMIGSTDISLGATGSSLAGLSSVTSTNYLGGTLAGTRLSGSFTGSFSGDGSGLSGIATSLGISGSSGAGSVNLKTQDLTIAGTSNEINAVASGQTITLSQPDDVTIGRDLTVSRNLVVQGTASFQHTTDLDIADRFIRLASGSSSTGDGGIAIQQTSGTVTELFGFDSGQTRFGITSSFDPSNTSFTPDAFMAAVVVGAGNDPDAAPARYDKKGNIFVASNQDIYIYS
tara:strand:+ start:1020 stop:2570 length:1551 start_codon:yes stop_codon:yes gene_type:complete